MFVCAPNLLQRPSVQPPSTSHLLPTMKVKYIWLDARNTSRIADIVHRSKCTAKGRPRHILTIVNCKTHILIVLVCVTYGVRVSGLGLHLYVYIDLNPHGPYVNKMFVEIWRDKSSKASRCVAHENESMRSGERRYFSHPEASEVICVKKIRERHLCQSPLGNICVPCGTTGPLFTLSQQTVAYVQGQGN